MYQAYHSIAVQHWHQEPTNDGKGTRGVRDPDTMERVLLKIDVDKLVREYGPRACYTKSRKTKQLHGIVEISKV